MISEELMLGVAASVSAAGAAMTQAYGLYPSMYAFLVLWVLSIASFEVIGDD
jgi:hypothetical protein